MHQYLDAIGFHNVKTKKQLYEILTQVETAFTQHELISQEEGVDFCEYPEGIRPRDRDFRCVGTWIWMNAS